MARSQQHVKIHENNQKTLRKKTHAHETSHVMSPMKDVFVTVITAFSSLSQLLLTVFVIAITALSGLISPTTAVTEQLHNCVK